MKIQDLKIGDKITHYCTGFLVEGTVIETGIKAITTEHEPVQYGKDIYTRTLVTESSYLQKKWGGTSELGLPCKGPDTTPGAWYEGTALTV